MDSNLMTHKETMENQFRDFIESEGRAKSTAQDYASKLFSYKWRTRANQELFKSLPELYRQSEEIGHAAASSLFKEIYEQKYTNYDIANSDEYSDEERLSAAKRANTADNYVTYLNWYDRWARHQASCQSLQIVPQKTFSSACNYARKSKPIISGSFFRDKIVKLRLETQDRVFKNVNRWDGKHHLYFPISMIKKILGGRSGLKDWEDANIRNTFVYAADSDNTLFRFTLPKVDSFRFTPQDEVFVLVSGNEYRLMSNDGVIFKPLKGRFTSDISIGHIPPISVVVSDLESQHYSSLPALEELTDFIDSYFNNIGKNNIKQSDLRSNGSKIAASRSWPSSFKDMLRADLKHLERIYELQGLTDNVRQGGTNRKNNNY